MGSDWIVKNLYWLVPSLLVVIGGIAAFIRWIIKKPKPSVESIQQSASPSLAEAANPSIIQQVIVHPSQDEEPKQQAAPPPIPPGTIKSSNIVFLRTRTAIVAGSSLNGVLLEKRNSKAALPTSQLSLHVFEMSL